MYCSNCGKKVSHSEELFCSECGSRLLLWSDSETLAEDDILEEAIDFSALNPKSILSDIGRINKKRLLLVFAVIIIGFLAVYQIVPLISDTKLEFAKEHIDEMAVYYDYMRKQAAEIELQKEWSETAVLSEGDQRLEDWKQKVTLAEQELFDLREELTKAEQKELDAYYIEKIGQDYLVANEM